jgi:16S rRNA (guanine966-N2)-methyltransferase
MARRPSPGNSGDSPPGRVRIVAGKWRSRRLPVADVAGLRPTSGRIRETLFNWLAPVIEGSTCLDLFAGTGALGLEALSRGAAHAVFVERSPQAARALHDNIVRLDADNATVLAIDAVAYLEHSAPRPFDVAFLDPPFGDENLSTVCGLLDSRGWLAAGAVVYLEQDRCQTRPTLPEGWTLKREKQAGNVRYALASVSGGAGGQTGNSP